MAGLAPADRGLVRAIVSIVLRRRGEIDAALAELMRRQPPKSAGPLRAILETAAAQILFMEVADHAAVSLAVEQAAADDRARHFKGLANAVLRALANRKGELLAGTVAEGVRADTPDWLRQRWVAAYGEPAAQAIAAAHAAEPPLDLSVRGDAGDWAGRLGGVALPTGSIRLVGAGRVNELAGYAEGVWWVQDVAATVPARLFGDVAGRTALDLCAAPGGKTAQLAAAGAAVTAVDIAGSRVERLRVNLARLGLAADCVTADAMTYDPGRRFDVVLLDAPCLATGTIRRHPDVPYLKRPADLVSLTALQAKLFDRAADLTAPGGTLVYATCSLEPEEGVEQARAALSRLPLDLVPLVPGEFPGLRPEWVRDGFLRTLPFHVPAEAIAGGMDGFFAARFRRR